MTFRTRNNFLNTGKSSDRRFGRGSLILLLLLVGLGWLGYSKYISMNLNKANAFLVAGDYDSAEEAYGRAARFPFSKGRGNDGLGALDLLRGDVPAARAHFQDVLSRKPSGSDTVTAEILGNFIDRGQYESGRIYVDFLDKWRTKSALEPFALELVALSLGARDLAAANAYLKETRPLLQKTERYASLAKMVREYEKEGSFPVLLDRNGQQILSYNVQTGDYDFASPRSFVGWQPEGGVGPLLEKMDAVDRQNRIQTTLDMNLQRAADQAMVGYKGTMILCDPKSGDILAAYGSEGYSPFLSTFEPGSVIKVLTYGMYLEGGGDVSLHAPKNYESSVRISDKIFWDWTRQGQLDTVEQGMAVSCNLMFAAMGQELSWPGLKKGFTRIFDGKNKPGFWGDASFGKIKSEPQDAWDLGRIAIGLDLMETSVLGLSLIPSSVANGGAPMVPRLFASYANIEGKIYKENKNESMGRFFSAPVATKLKASMSAAVTEKRGTARNAQVPYVETAMKTGTSGEKPFNSVMVGLFPKDNPKVTFALFLHNGGKCETHGARVAKRLLDQIKAFAPEYLEN